MFYSVNGSSIRHDNDLLAKLDRMIVLGCSDAYINQSLIEVNTAFDYIGSWFVLVIGMVFFNLYIDYCGLYLSYGGTWSKMNRVMCRLLKGKYCCPKQKHKSDEET
jgi:hypothetical protein